jgi:hypothetical protein
MQTKTFAVRKMQEHSLRSGFNSPRQACAHHVRTLTGSATALNGEQQPNLVIRDRLFCRVMVTRENVGTLPYYCRYAYHHIYFGRDLREQTLPGGAAPRCGC